MLAPRKTESAGTGRKTCKIMRMLANVDICSFMIGVIMRNLILRNVWTNQNAVTEKAVYVASTQDLKMHEM